MSKITINNLSDYSLQLGMICGDLPDLPSLNYFNPKEILIIGNSFSSDGYVKYNEYCNPDILSIFLWDINRSKNDKPDEWVVVNKTNKTIIENKLHKWNIEIIFENNDYLLNITNGNRDSNSNHKNLYIFIIILILLILFFIGLIFLRKNK